MCSLPRILRHTCNRDGMCGKNTLAPCPIKRYPDPTTADEQRKTRTRGTSVITHSSRTRRFILVVVPYLYLVQSGHRGALARGDEGLGSGA